MILLNLSKFLMNSMQARFRSKWRKGPHCGSQDEICISSTIGVDLDCQKQAFENVPLTLIFFIYLCWWFEVIIGLVVASVHTFLCHFHTFLVVSKFS